MKTDSPRCYPGFQDVLKGISTFFYNTTKLSKLLVCPESFMSIGWGKFELQHFAPSRSMWSVMLLCTIQTCSWKTVIGASCLFFKCPPAPQSYRCHVILTEPRGSANQIIWWSRRSSWIFYILAGQPVISTKSRGLNQFRVCTLFAFCATRAIQTSVQLVFYTQQADGRVPASVNWHVHEAP